MIRKYILTFALSLGLTMSATTPGSCNETEGLDTVAPATPGTVWVWSEKSENQYAVMLSQSVEDGWTETEKVSDNDSVNVVPAVTKINKENLLIVWSSFKNGQSQLLYRLQEEGKWGDETAFYTGLASNTAPAVAVDKEGTIWLVWVGFNGLNDEIYFSTWDSAEFSTPTPITSNSVPDILPVLGVDTVTGLPWIQWQQYTDSGYVDYQSFWQDDQWTEPILVPATVETVDEAVAPSTTEQKNALVKKTAGATDGVSVAVDTEIEIPEFVTEPDSASLYLPGYEIQSLPVRSMIRVEQQ